MATILYRQASLRDTPARRPIAEILGYGPGEVARRLLDVLLTWQERAAQRRALTMLDDRMLKDIGLSRADVAIESSRPFWRP